VFGEPPKAAEEFTVLKQKKLRELEISKHLKSEAVQYLDQWISLGNQDEFLKKVYFTLVEIHTVLRN